MSSLFGIEASRAVQFAIAFAIILILLVLFGVVFRKLTGARLMMPSSDRGRSRQPRLGIVDVYDLDRQRQLLLLRRDNVEHLLLIGGPNDVVIETNIVRVAGARVPAPSNDTGTDRFDPVLEQAPRAPQVEASGRPSIESQLAAQLGAFVRRPSEETDAGEELAPVAAVSAPIPARPEPMLKPDAVAVSAAPAIQGLRAEAKTSDLSSAPPVSAAMDRPEPRPAVTPIPFQSRPTPMPPVPSAAPVHPEPVRAPQPVVSETSAERPTPDAGLLSDMAKQLEEALKRPASPVSPPPALPAAPAPVAPPVVHEDVSDENDVIDSDPILADEEPAARHDAAPDDQDGVTRPEEAVLRAEPPAVEPPRPAPPTPPASAPLPPQTREAPVASDKASDPFSVEDIEAEFARLLGRPLDPSKKA